jgi:histidinol-phosphate aminotransferase
VKQAQAQAQALVRVREQLHAGLESLGVEVSPGSRAPFLLCRLPGRPDLRDALRDKGIAVRRGDTFPGLSPEHWRTAVRDQASSEALLTALATLLT